MSSEMMKGEVRDDCSQNTVHLTCQICKKKFSTKWARNRHLRELHSGPHEGPYTDKSPSKCCRCNRLFQRREHFSIHMKYGHREAGWKPRISSWMHKCDTCEKEFRTEQNLTDHKREIHNNTIYECNQCPAKFSWKKTLSKHMKSGKHYQKFYCDICKKTLVFPTAEALQKHVTAKNSKEGIKITCKGARATSNYIIKAGKQDVQEAKEEFIQGGLAMAK